MRSFASAVRRRPSSSFVVLRRPSASFVVLRRPSSSFGVLRRPSLSFAVLRRMRTVVVLSCCLVFGVWCLAFGVWCLVLFVAVVVCCCCCCCRNSPARLATLPTPHHTTPHHRCARHFISLTVVILVRLREGVISPWNGVVRWLMSKRQPPDPDERRRGDGRQNDAKGLFLCRRTRHGVASQDVLPCLTRVTLCSHILAQEHKNDLHAT